MIPSMMGQRMSMLDQDPYYSSVSLLLLPHLQAPGSTTIVDYSNNAHTITTTGNVVVSEIGTFGRNVIEFDGVNDALTIPTSSAFDLGSGDFTLEVGYKNRGGPHQAYGRIFQTRNGDVSGALCLFFDTPSGDYTYVTMSSNGSTNNILSLSNGGLLSSHSHFAISKSGNTLRTFVQGGVATTNTISGGTALYYNAADTIVIGGQTSGTQRTINAYLTYLRLTKGVCRYTAAYGTMNRPPWNY